MSVLSFSKVAHPEYIILSEEWEKYRYIMNSGSEFIDKYLKKFSSRESDLDFRGRREVTPTAAFAKGAIIDIKNSIYQRMSDIIRTGGTPSYQQSIHGLNGGVDKCGSSMNYFIGKKILPELLFLGKIGVFVDMPRLNGKITLAQAQKIKPYFYPYSAEDIINWEVDYRNNTMEFTQLLLRDNYYKTNIIGLPGELTYRFRLLQKTDNGIIIKFYNRKTFEETDTELLEPDEEYVLNLSKIPFVLFELDQPLTRDIANHQIALMNMESSDISYALKANYPFYTEQRVGLPGSYLKNEENDENGTEIEVGGNVGRAYPKGAERPDFIHPSSEPLHASMEKQKNLKDDIRMLVNLSLSNIKSKYASAESKEMDERGLESGLSAIGLLLEQCERDLAVIFSDYENSNEIATIAYPQKYSLKSDLQKLNEVEKLASQRDKIPSRKCQKIISKKMASILIGPEIPINELDDIYSEIDNADYITSDPEDIERDIERGLVSLETASMARGYNKEEIEKAKKDHAERLARIQQSQASARGLDDFSSIDGAAKLEKQTSQNPDLDDTGKKKVKGN